MGRRVWRWVRAGLLTLGGILVVVGLALLFILQVWRSDEFEFLGGRNPILAGQMSPMEVDDFVSPGRHIPACEYRIYSWKQDFKSVQSTAAKELATLGFVAEPLKELNGDYALWSRWDDQEVWLQSGRSRTRQDAMGGKANPDSAWVTVICTNDAPENWITHVRIAFEPSDW